MSRRYRGRGSSDGSGSIAMAIIAVVALPVVGLYKIVKGDEDDKALGAVLLVIGLIIWIVILNLGFLIMHILILNFHILRIWRLFKRYA